MSLEVLNTLGTLTTVVIVGATAIAALVQLRHLQAANRINALMGVFSELETESVGDAAALTRQKLAGAIDDPTFREFVVARARGKRLPDVKREVSDLAAAARLICNSYEELGILVKRRLVDADVVLDRYNFAVLGTWKAAEHFIGLVREAIGRDDIWENFEYLTVLSEDWIAQHPSSYPRGVRRMQITNRWPIAARATT